METRRKLLWFGEKLLGEGELRHIIMIVILSFSEVLFLFFLFKSICVIQFYFVLIKWNSYRLSLSWMQSLADHSTHLRTTCNFVKDGLQYTDYARAKLVDQDIFGRWDSVWRMYEYINIRGNNCSDCTAMTKQNYNEPWTIKSRSKDCTFDGYSG